MCLCDAQIRSPALSTLALSIPEYTKGVPDLDCTKGRNLLGARHGVLHSRVLQVVVDHADDLDLVVVERRLEVLRAACVQREVDARGDEEVSERDCVGGGAEEAVLLVGGGEMVGGRTSLSGGRRGRSRCSGLLVDLSVSI